MVEDYKDMSLKDHIGRVEGNIKADILKDDSPLHKGISTISRAGANGLAGQVLAWPLLTRRTPSFS